MWDLIVSVPDHCLSFYLSSRACHGENTKTPLFPGLTGTVDTN